MAGWTGGLRPASWGATDGWMGSEWRQTLMRLRTPIPARPHSSVSASSAEVREVSAVSFAEESSDDMMLLGWPSEERLVGVDSSTGLLFGTSGVTARSTGS